MAKWTYRSVPGDEVDPTYYLACCDNVDVQSYDTEAEALAAVRFHTAREAAPDLLAACQRVLDVINTLTQGKNVPLVIGKPTQDALRAAVAKATAPPECSDNS